MPAMRIGTCSWKYPSWEGLVYSRGVENYLQEYSRKYSTVEIDQWFWSLFPGNKIRLPDSATVEEYRAAVPASFRFSVKIPNSITLTHAYSKEKSTLGPKNRYFLSRELLSEFLKLLEPLENTLGPLIFQFEYLNRQKMESQAVFERTLADFRKTLPAGRQYALEIRNGNYLNERFLEYLQDQEWCPVLLQGYWMPPAVDLWRKMERQIRAFATVIFRLHGTGREAIEEETGKVWNRIVTPREKELEDIAGIASHLAAGGKEIYVNVNNHFEGSAPLTIERFQKFFKP